MAERKGQEVENQDECMQSIESSTTSLSLENIETELLLPRTNPVDTSAMGTISQLSMEDELESMLIGGPSSNEISLEITEQPKPKDLRFRYECEGRSAGSILAEKSNNDRKFYPTVKLNNYRGKVKFVVSLVTRNSPQQLHPNGLVGKLCQDGICSMIVDPNDRMTFSFPNLGIQCAKKKDIPTALESRRRLGVDPFNQFPSSSRGDIRVQDYEMNVVCLCFQAFLPYPENPDQYTRELPPQVSQPIFDKKGASLNISRVDRNSGTVIGGDEVFILCDKVQKDDIEVIFFHGDWQKRASFGPSDIHRQVAIVCRTPPFKDKTIKNSVTVQFKLRRRSDGETSDPVEFIYRPIDQDEDGVVAKRRKKAPHFQNFFKEPPEVKQETSEQVQPCGGPLSTSQQPATYTNTGTASGISEQTVRQLLRATINNRQPAVVPVTVSLDIRQPPREFLRAVRKAPGNQVVVSYPTDSSTVVCNQSNLTFGTMTQRDPTPATVTTGEPFTFLQGTDTTISVPAAFKMAPTESSINQSQISYVLNSFEVNTTAPTMQVNLTNSTIPGDDRLSGEALDDNLMNIKFDLNGEHLESLLTDSSLNLGELQPSSVSIEQFTSMHEFDPSTLGIVEGDLNDMIFDERIMEDINNSLSIPYSHSVELDHEAPP